MPREEFNVHETTTAANRQKGLRELIIELHRNHLPSAFGPDQRHIVSVMAVTREDISLDGEAPAFETLPDVVMSNTDLARALMAAAQNLLDHPRLSRISFPATAPVLDCKPS